MWGGESITGPLAGSHGSTEEVNVMDVYTVKEKWECSKLNAERPLICGSVYKVELQQCPHTLLALIFKILVGWQLPCKNRTIKKLYC